MTTLKNKHSKTGSNYFYKQQKYLNMVMQRRSKRHNGNGKRSLTKINVKICLRFYRTCLLDQKLQLKYSN